VQQILFLCQCKVFKVFYVENGRVILPALSVSKSHIAIKNIPTKVDGMLLPIDQLNYGVLDGLLGYSLRRAQSALYADFAAATAAFDITPQRFAALVIIDANPGIHQGLLAQAMGIDRSGSLRLIDWLCARKWALRRADASDARRWGVALTALGKRTLVKVSDAVRAHDAACLARLGPAGAALKPLLDQFVQTFQPGDSHA
jgi:DNA-binding MarR family transcriptional regulator